MIPAHGATITVSPAEIHIRYSPLLAALHGPGVRIALDDVATVTVLATPSDTECGRVFLDGVNHTVVFAPNQQQPQQQFITAIETAHTGETPPLIPGFDFVAIDVETANTDWGSICQVGMVRVIDGNIAEKESWLCQPPATLSEFEKFNISIHGITPDDVANEPNIAEKLPEVAAFIGDLPVIAHNAQFDMGAIFRACEITGSAIPQWTFGCTLALARHSNISFPKHNLPTVAETLGIMQTRHHDAADDALTCARIAIALAQQANFTGDFLSFFRDQGFAPGEIQSHRVYPVLRATRSMVIEQKKSDAAPKQRSAAWAKAATPEVIPAPNLDADPENSLFKQNVTLSGDFEPYDKGMLWERMADLGATVGKNVTKKTTVLVCGPWASVTSKQKRAEELIEKGQAIEIWTAEKLYDILGLNEEPPF